MSSLPQGTGLGQLFPLIPSAWPRQGSKALRSPGERGRASQGPPCQAGPLTQKVGTGARESHSPSVSCKIKTKGVCVFKCVGGRGCGGIITEGSGGFLLGFASLLHHPATLQVVSCLGLDFLPCNMQLATACPLESLGLTDLLANTYGADCVPKRYRGVRATTTGQTNKVPGLRKLQFCHREPKQGCTRRRMGFSLSKCHGGAEQAGARAEPQKTRQRGDI